MGADKRRRTDHVSSIRMRPGMYLGTRVGTAAVLALVTGLEEEFADLAFKDCALEFDSGGQISLFLGCESRQDLVLLWSALRSGLVGRLTRSKESFLLAVFLACTKRFSMNLSVDGRLESLEADSGRFRDGVLPDQITSGAGEQIVLRAELDPEVIEAREVMSEPVVERVSVWAARRPDVRFRVCETSRGQEQEFSFTHGWIDYLHRSRGKRVPLHAPILLRCTHPELSASLCLQWTNEAGPAIATFVNAHRAHAGAHIEGLQEGLWEAVHRFGERVGIRPYAYRPAADLDGLIAVLDVRLRGTPTWIGSLRGELANEGAVTEIIRDWVSEALTDYWEEHRDVGASVIRHVAARHLDYWW